MCSIPNLIIADFFGRHGKCQSSISFLSFSPQYIFKHQDGVIHFRSFFTPVPMVTYDDITITNGFPAFTFFQINRKLGFSVGRRLCGSVSWLVYENEFRFCDEKNMRKTDSKACG